MLCRAADLLYGTVHLLPQGTTHAAAAAASSTRGCSIPGCHQARVTLLYNAGNKEKVHKAKKIRLIYGPHHTLHLGCILSK